MLYINKRDIVKFVFGAAGLILCAWGYLSNFSGANLAIAYTLFLSIYLIFACRKSYILVILFSVLAYCNYSIAFSEYLNVLSGTLFTQYANTTVAYQAAYVLLLFWSVFTVLCPLPKDKVGYSSIEWHITDMNKNHIYLVLAMNVLLVFILVFAYTRPDVIGTSRGKPSALYEYSIEFFILCYYYGRQSKLCTTITTVVLMLFVMQNFIYGGRITGLQLLILWYIMVLSERYSLKKLLPFIIVGFVILQLIGAVRGAWTESGITIKALLSELWTDKFTLDTAYSSYHTSMTFLLTEEKVGMSERLRIFGNFILSIFLGGYGTAENSVAHYTAQYYVHYNGGILPFFFQFYFGSIGVVFIGILMTAWIKLCNKATECTGLTKCIVVYFVVTAFRWYLYSPIQITRGVLLMALSYGVSRFILYLLGGVLEKLSNDIFLSRRPDEVNMATSFSLRGGAVA